MSIMKRILDERMFGSKKAEEVDVRRKYRRYLNPKPAAVRPRQKSLFDETNSTGK